MTFVFKGEDEDGTPIYEYKDDPSPEPKVVEPQPVEPQPPTPTVVPAFVPSDITVTAPPAVILCALGIGLFILYAVISDG